MKQNATSRWGTLLMLALLSLLPGCTSKIPSSLPLAESEKPFILSRFREFQSRSCIKSLDADVTMEWQMYGKTEKIPGMLQLQSPAFLRYSVVDPLGRQLFILVSDGNTFTLVDNSKARALTGQVNSNFWKKYIPSFIVSADYLSWLTGRLPAGFYEVKEIRKDQESAAAAWLISGWQNSIRHHVLFFPATGQVTRHIVQGDNDEILLDVVYANYDSGGLACARPSVLKFEGAKISGILKISFDEVFPEATIAPSIFHLNLPSHFTVKTVD